jgi:hypothetical protein
LVGGRKATADGGEEKTFTTEAQRSRREDVHHRGAEARRKRRTRKNNSQGGHGESRREVVLSFEFGVLSWKERMMNRFKFKLECRVEK